MKRTFIMILFAVVFSCVRAQYAWQDGEYGGKMRPLANLQYNVEMQASVSEGKTPLWLNANKHGLSSLETGNGYVRGSIVRPLQTDSARRWGLGYGVDIAGAYHYTSKSIVQQAFVEMRWLHGVLSVGSKEYAMQLKNNMLSSGSQTLGINARPVPQVRLALPEYWTLPVGRGWLHIKGHVAYGKMTDDNWQHDFTQKQSKFSDDVLFHSKSGYLLIGNPERFYPLSLELGLEMASTFGGSNYYMKNGKLEVIKGGTGPKDFLNAFLPGGADVPEQGTAFQNAEGNQLGSWLMRVNYDADTWRIGMYVDKYFEDHSSMLQLDYDGYGTGDNWNVNTKRRYLLYDFKDMLLGFELNFSYSRWVKDMVLEYVYTKYQSGPVYHDHNQTTPDHIGGMDNYYNHYIYTGWQHWGQVMGNPLYRSPIYNEDGSIEVQNNRFKAFHLGMGGSPADRLEYRIMATYQVGWGTYSVPYTRKHHNASFMIESVYGLGNGWKVKGAYGMDFGHILGHNCGFQLTVSKSGLLKL